MRYIAFILLLFAGLSAQSQTAPPALTLNGIGEIKVHMKLADLRKITGQPLKLDRLMRKKDWDRDTFNIVYKTIPCQVIIDRDYLTETENSFIVTEVSSQSPLLRTKSGIGIGIGDDKMKIINTYTDYMIQLLPDYDDAEYTVKSKTRSTVWLYGDDGQVLVFHLVNGKVVSFSVSYSEGC